MVTRPQVSFIIPARTCLPNLAYLVTDLLNLELETQVVVVDTSDSHESSPLDSLGHLLERIDVVQVPGGQPGVARNRGLDLATGHWIGFIDDDDGIDSDEFHQVSSSGCLESDVDVLGFGFQVETGGKRERSPIPARDSAGVLHADPLGFWRYLFRREFLCVNGICFPDGLVGEDIVFLYRAISVDPSISSCEEAFYVYRRLPTGVSSIADDRWLVIPRQMELAFSACKDRSMYALWMETWRRNIVAGLLSTPVQHWGAYVRESTHVIRRLPGGKLKRRASTLAVGQLLQQMKKRIF